MGNNAPCLGCEERHLGCHADCERYIAFSQDIERVRVTRQKDRELNNLINGYNKAKATGFAHSSFGKK